MTSVDSSLKFWELVGEWGFIFVWIGVVGEGGEIFIKLFSPKLYKTKQLCFDIIGAIFWVILVVALAVEFFGNTKSMRISDRQNAMLNNQANQARKEADDAKLQISQITQTNLLLAVIVEELHSNNLVLAAKVQPREITSEQEKKFISFCKNIPKMPIKVFIGASDNETEAFTEQVRKMLDAAGFGGPDAGIVRDNTLYVTRLNDVSFITPIVFIKNDTNMPAGYGQFVVPNSAQTKIVDMIGNGFESIGFKPSWISQDANQYLKQGEAAILIPQKNIISRWSD